MSDGPVSVALLNDYEVVVEGLAQMLERFNDRVQVKEVTVETAPDATVDVALYDAFGTAAQDNRWSKLLGRGWSARTVVLYTWKTDVELPAMAAEDWPLRLSKTRDGEALVDAIEQISSTGSLPEDGDRRDPGRGTARCWPGKDAGLTEREAEVLALIASGLGNHEIADSLYYSVNTIKTRIRHLYRKIGASNRVDAVHWAVDHGFRH